MSMDDKLNAAVEKHKQGNVSDAVSVYQEILKSDPKHPDALHYFGLAHMGTGQFEKAADLIRLSVTYNPDNAKAWSNLGSALKNANRIGEAGDALQKACILAPDFCDAHYNLGVVLTAQAKLDEAEQHYKKALEIVPNHIDSLCNLGCLYQIRDDMETAEAYFQEALAIDPTYPPALNNAGYVFYMTDDFQAAKEAFDEVIKTSPNFAEAHYNRALIDEHYGHIDEALARHEHAISLNPNYAEPHFSMGYYQLLRGDFENGWKNYEWRLKRQSYIPQIYTAETPRWQGQYLEADKSLLVYSEQGLGDSMQVVRFLEMVKSRAPNVILMVQPALMQLFAPNAKKHGIELVANTEAIPKTDFQIPMMSLPFALNITESNLPADMPYMEANAAKIKEWQAKLGTVKNKLKIGITWRGSANKQLDKGRSFPLALYKIIREANPDIRIISLQKGPGEDEIDALEKDLSLEVYDLDPQRDFTDTAALIKNLDLVIACDSSIAHLAGNLDVPVWLVCKKRSEWRWMLNRQDSPWYPSMHIFRPTTNEWDGVFNEMATAIKSL